MYTGVFSKHSHVFIEGMTIILPLCALQQTAIQEIYKGKVCTVTEHKHTETLHNK